MVALERAPTKKQPENKSGFGVLETNLVGNVGVAYKIRASTNEVFVYAYVKDLGQPVQSFNVVQLPGMLESCLRRYPGNRFEGLTPCFMGDQLYHPHGIKPYRGRK